MPQLNISPRVEPLILERQRLAVGEQVVETALFDARYDYGDKTFHGYTLLDGKVQRSTCALKPHEAACAVSDWVHGWITTGQRTRLYELARGVPKEQVIVEVGSWKGKSTAILGWGSKAGNRAVVWAIDPHEATPLYWILHNHGAAASTYDQFAANMTAGGVIDVVFPLAVPSQQAALLVREPVGLLFLDGDHHYAALDTQLWMGHVAPGGWIALHDTNFTTVQTGLALLADSGQFGAPELVDNMAVLRRRDDK